MRLRNRGAIPFYTSSGKFREARAEFIYLVAVAAMPIARAGIERKFDTRFENSRKLIGPVTGGRNMFKFCFVRLVRLLQLFTFVNIDTIIRSITFFILYIYSIHIAEIF